MNENATQKVAELQMRLSLSEANELDLETAIEFLTHLLWNTSIVWQTSDIRGKSSIQQNVP
jgi:imidazoleglycerol phosphate dehydratase HisB